MTPLPELRCAGCGAETSAGKRFCGDCGLALVESRTRPVVERRLCSVVFLDLVGFTSASEGRDPEDVRALLSRYFQLATKVASRYGGVIEKFIGDAVMAVWGTPLATEDDAERAVRAALELVDSVNQLGAENGIDGLAARCGVLTGEVAVAVGAKNEGMVAGDAVNTAARIQAAADPNAVFVTATTRRLTEQAIEYRDEGDHTLKGKSEPERLWRAVRVVSGIGGVQRVDGLEAPLTGRGAELRTIREMFHASVDRREPRLVLITGVAGVGKSRLGWEFEKYTDGLAGEVSWHRGRCLSYGEGVVYRAFTDVVRQRLGIADDDPLDVAATRLANGLVRWVPDASDRTFVGMSLSRLLGVPVANDTGAAITRDELFAGWRRFVECVAAVDPVVILIEDAHHGTTDLFDFLDHLVDWSRDLPIFVVVFARPEISVRRHGLGTGRNRATIALAPLDEASMDAVVDRLVPRLPPEARRRITDRAEGLPLYALECVRSMIDRDVIRPAEGVYQLVGEIGELAVPDSLRALLAARLDALDPLSRRVIADAAVIGTSFPAEALVAVSGLDAATSVAVLGDLVRRELLDVTADPRSPERGSYRFSQEMLREVAYVTLSRRDRKSRHLAVAAHLRATYATDGEEVIDVVADHYADAMGAVPGDADNAEIRTLLVAALVRSAERALRTGAPQQAVASYSTAAGLIAESDTPSAAELWLSASFADRATTFHQRSLDHAERAYAAFSEHGLTRAAARAQVSMARNLRRLGRHADARGILREAIAALDAERDLDLFDALDELATVETLDGSSAAGPITREAAELGDLLGVDAGRMAGILVTRAIHHDLSGRRRLAAMHFREAARQAEMHGDRLQAIDAYGNLSSELNVDDPDEAFEAASTALELVPLVGASYTIPTILQNISMSRLAAGDWHACEQFLFVHSASADAADSNLMPLFQAEFLAIRGDSEASRERLAHIGQALETEDQQERAVVDTTLAFIAWAEGDLDTALDHALQSTDLLGNGLPFGGDEGRWLWPMAARTAHQLARFDVEAALLAQYDAELAGVPARMQHAEARLIRARLADAASDTHTGAIYADAIDGLRTDSTPYHLAQGLLDYAEFLIRTGDAPLAPESLIAEAADVADQLGCPPLRRRADAIGATTPERVDAITTV